MFNQQTAENRTERGRNGSVVQPCADRPAAYVSGNAPPTPCAARAQINCSICARQPAQDGCRAEQCHARVELRLQGRQRHIHDRAIHKNHAGSQYGARQNPWMCLRKARMAGRCCLDRRFVAWTTACCQTHRDLIMDKAQNIYFKCLSTLAGEANQRSFGTSTFLSGCVWKFGDMICTSFSLNMSCMLP